MVSTKTLNGSRREKEGSVAREKGGEEEKKSERE